MASESPSSAVVYQLKVSLREIEEPPVWRRLLVSSEIRLAALHHVIQRAMGWEDAHLHVFSDGSRQYGHPDPELGYQDERRVRLSRLLAEPGDSLDYTYDFGDGWDHEVVLEQTVPVAGGEREPRCLAGEGACPPEDSGGAWGYADLKEILADPGHEEHHEMLEWLGLDSAVDFDPAAFSVDDVNTDLEQLTATRARR